MDWVLAVVIAVPTLGWLANNWIRAKYGYPLEDDEGNKTQPVDSAETRRLRAENRELHGKLDAMQDRLIVLEKIVTDRGYSLASEIEALRDAPVRDTAGSGVPLGLAGQERA